MTDEEFDVLDALYFVIGFRELSEACEQSPNDLKSILLTLHDRGWIKVLEDVDNEILSKSLADVNLESCFFLASKQGLLAHNS